MNDNLNEMKNNLNELNNSIALLSLEDRTKILEYISGRNKNIDYLEIGQAVIASKVLAYKEAGLDLPSELNPETWTIPENKGL